MEEQVDLYLDGTRESDPEDFSTEDGAEITEEDRENLKERAKKVISRIDGIDGVLNRTAIGWKTSRFGSCDLAILRVAVYEIRYDSLIPTGVAINEAVELAKHYGSGQSPAFVNGVLGEIAREEA